VGGSPGNRLFRDRHSLGNSDEKTWRRCPRPPRLSLTALDHGCGGPTVLGPVSRSQRAAVRSRWLRDKYSTRTVGSGESARLSEPGEADVSDALRFLTGDIRCRSKPSATSCASPGVELMNAVICAGTRVEPLAPAGAAACGCGEGTVPGCERVGMRGLRGGARVRFA